MSIFTLGCDNTKNSNNNCIIWKDVETEIIIEFCGNSVINTKNNEYSDMLQKVVNVKRKFKIITKNDFDGITIYIIKDIENNKFSYLVEKRFLLKSKEFASFNLPLEIEFICEDIDCVMERIEYIKMMKKNHNLNYPVGGKFVLSK